MSAKAVTRNSFASSRHRWGADAATLAEVADAMVRLYKEAFGRGPTKARSMFAGPDALLVMLEDALTTAERTLLAVDGEERLRGSRLVVQQALEKRARAVVEDALGRRTLAYITGIDPRRATATILFTLEPVGRLVDDENGNAW